MKTVKTNLDKSKKYVLACSFGPDSMALLNTCINEGINLVVAHVNYHHREEANFEQTELEKYCKSKNIEIETLSVYDNQIKGNFEAWARNVRYIFFKDVCEKHKCDAVLVAHHQDDLIETYLMQIKRKKFYKNYGIASETIINNIKIIRPFLEYSKIELLNYCVKNNIPFSVDKTNESNEFERNKIRHEIVNKLSADERTKIIKEINEKIPVKVDIKSEWKTKDFLALSYEQIVCLIDTLLCRYNQHKNLSNKFINNLKESLNSKKANFEIKLNKTASIYKAYDDIYFINKIKLSKFNLVVSKQGKASNEFLDIDFSNGATDRKINENDYPISIRNISKKDKLLIDKNLCEISRVFIDWKMPLFVRGIWPGIYNKNNELIYVPRYRKNFVDNHTSVLKINIDYFLL